LTTLTGEESIFKLEPVSAFKSNYQRLRMVGGESPREGAPAQVRRDGNGVHEERRDTVSAQCFGRDLGQGRGARACLATGARWSEAEGLTAKQVRGNGSATIGTRTPKAEWCRLFSEIVWRFGVLFICGKMPSMSYIRSFVPPKWAVHESRIYSSKYVSQACTLDFRH